MLMAAGMILLPVFVCLLGAARFYGGYTIFWLAVSMLAIFVNITTFLVSFYKPDSETTAKRPVAFVLPYIATNILSLIVLFGEIYRRTGIQPADASKAPNHDFWTCIYFSCTTWTTLGYGDYSPDGVTAQAFSSIEALLGYVAMGLMISALVNILK